MKKSLTRSEVMSVYGIEKEDMYNEGYINEKHTAINRRLADNNLQGVLGMLDLRNQKNFRRLAEAKQWSI